MSLSAIIVVSWTEFLHSISSQLIFHEVNYPNVATAVMHAFVFPWITLRHSALCLPLSFSNIALAPSLQFYYLVAAPPCGVTISRSLDLLYPGVLDPRWSHSGL